MQFFESVLQVVIVGAVHRVQAAVNHRRHAAIAGQRLGRGIFRRRHGVADAHVADVFQAAGDEADVARRELRHFHRRGLEAADVRDLEDFARRHHAKLHAFFDEAVHQPDMGDDALVRVEIRIEDQRAERFFFFAGGGGNPLDNRFQYIVHAEPGLRRRQHRVRRVKADGVLNFLFHLFRVGAGKIDFVDDGNNFKVVLQCHIDICQRLRFHALRRVHHEQRALAGGEASRHLVGEIHMARRVDKVQFVGFAVLRFIGQAHGLRLDGDAALALQLHRVEHLLLHLAFGECSRPLNQSVGKC